MGRNFRGFKAVFFGRYLNCYSDLIRDRKFSRGFWVRILGRFWGWVWNLGSDFLGFWRGSKVVKYAGIS
jgi:hypothetical protein